MRLYYYSVATSKLFSENGAQSLVLRWLNIKARREASGILGEKDGSETQLNVGGKEARKIWLMEARFRIFPEINN